jgi:hypothetical protein
LFNFSDHLLYPFGSQIAENPAVQNHRQEKGTR